MKNLSIRTRLTIWYTFMITLFLVTAFALLYTVLEQILMQQRVDSVLSNSFIIADEVDREDEEDGYENSFELDEEEKETLASGTLYAIYSKDNKWIYGEKAPWIDDIAIDYDSARQISHNGDNWLVYDRLAYDDGELAGWVRVLLPLKDMQIFLEKLLLTWLVMAPIGILLAVIGGLFIAGRALKPIANITQTAEHMGAGDLSTRIQHTGANDEVGKLAMAFNDMADKLEEAFTREKQFTTDASHEMRTPLAVIISYAEDAMKRQTPDRYADAVAIILEKSKQMQGMLNQLLLLARGYEEALCMERIDLTSIIVDIAEEMQEQAQQKGIMIELELATDVIINADMLMITRMFMNLIANSIKYGKDGGFIKINLAKQDKYAAISICDNGIGIAEIDQPHIFERFYRSDKSRTGNNGAGLGLAFVQLAVQQHGGSISLKSTPGEGSCFRILL